MAERAACGRSRSAWLDLQPIDVTWEHAPQPGSLAPVPGVPPESYKQPFGVHTPHRQMEAYVKMVLDYGVLMNLVAASQRTKQQVRPPPPIFYYRVG